MINRRKKRQPSPSHRRKKTVRPFLPTLQIAEQIRQRAEEVVFAEWTTSNFRPVNTDSYRVFEENGWWLLPWAEILAEEES